MAGTRQKAEQLEQLLAGGVDADGVDAQFAGLADLARAVSDSASLATPNPAFREALRTQLLTAPLPTAAPVPAEIGVTEKVRRFVEQRGPELVQSGRAVAATVVGATLVASGGVFGVAQQSLPGDLLYPVKDATEDLRLAFTSGTVERGRLHLQFAEERLSELEAGVSRLTADLIADTLDRLDDEVLDAANDLLSAFADSADLALIDELTLFTGDAGSRLSALRQLVPAEVAGRLDDSVEILRRVEIQVDVALGTAGCDCEPDVTLATSRDSFIARPGEGPAVASNSCDCTPAARQPAPSPSVDPAPSSPEPQAPVAPQEPQAPEPVDQDPETLPTLPAPIDPIADELEAVIDDLLDQLPVDPVEQIPAPVRTPVNDVRRQVNQGVSDTSKTIDEILP